MSKEIYNLQVPIPVELKEELKRLAKEDDRTLRAFCKRILENYVNGNYVIDDTLKVENTNSKNASSNKDHVADFDFNFESVN